MSIMLVFKGPRASLQGLVYRTWGKLDGSLHGCGFGRMRGLLVLDLWLREAARGRW